MKVHDFNGSLARSHAQEDAPWWPTVYRRAFPGFLAMHSVRQDGWAQRGGIDRVIVLKSGKTLHVDEKVRSKSYPDIALERWSDRERRTLGWMQKALATDYLAYAFVPDQRCYLFPFPQLRTAWCRNGREWIAKAEDRRDGFSIALAQNPGYVTESVCVPTQILLSALSEAQVVEWKAAA